MDSKIPLQVVKPTLSTADLLAVTGYASVGAMRRSLESQGVPLFEGKDGPWTTVDLINAAKLGNRNSGPADARYSPEML